MPDSILDWLFIPYSPNFVEREPHVSILFPVSYAPCTTIIAALVWLLGMLLIREIKDVENRKEYAVIFSATVVALLLLPLAPVVVFAGFGFHWLYCHLLGIDME